MLLIQRSVKRRNLLYPQAWLILFLFIWETRRAESLESKIGRCPPLIDSHPSYCRTNVSACSSDSECEENMKCCNDGCINVCIEPRLSACEHRYLSIERQASSDQKSLQTIPKCKTNGDFEPIQCNEISNECWCINENGFEIAGTRSSSKELVNCSAPRLCSGLMCRMLCPYDFELDENGCPLCQCRDPCSGVKCPGNQQCHLEDVECDSESCPPVPSCKQPRFLETVCPNGEPLFLSESSQPFLCGLKPNQPQCPPFFKCITPEKMEYGSCCPTFEGIEKPGKCPSLHSAAECGTTCNSDIDCIGLLKCCQSEMCGFHCVTSNSTVCEQQKMLAELMSRNEKGDHGYIPQCTEFGEFEKKQCSRNGLVCWCVTKEGKQISRTMGPAENVSCSEELEVISSPICDPVICSAFCAYGFKLDDDGCQTCDCTEPCDEFNCPENTKCMIASNESCIESFCSSVPTCQLNDQHRKSSYICPPYEDRGCLNETVCASDEDCPENSKCCPHLCGSNCVTFLPSVNRLPTMCEYLRSYALTIIDSPMAHTLAYPIPTCTDEGLYNPVQCNDRDECWCVDEYGAELFGTRTSSSDVDCTKAQSRTKCSGLMCRLGCDYGFEKDDKGCSFCECRNPCDTIECVEGMHCQLAEIETLCTSGFCPPVPQCLPKGKSSSLCAIGDPLWDSSTNETWICGRDNLICPETHICTKEDEHLHSIGVCCLKPDQACDEPKVVGFCDEVTERWFYNNDTGRCEFFAYSGCGGNNNNFASKDLCETTCIINLGTSPKNGSCPDVSPDEMGTCANECLNDAECPGPQKCCLNGCEAYVCRDPLGSSGKDGQCPFLISATPEMCDFQCKSDFDCNGELKCCSNGCGTRCAVPDMKTACEHQKAVAEYKLHQEGVHNSLMFIPKCHDDGRFFDVQCSIINQSCWCVNESGKEISGTRSYNLSVPNCGDPSECPSSHCDITCEFGYELNSQGCALCQCHEPCSDLICSESEECRMVQVKCITTPCPPIPICLPKIENPCSHGEPLQDIVSKNIIKCGPHGTQCPSTHQCHLSPLGEFAVCCPKPRDVCLQSLDSGRCLALIPRWRFNLIENVCEEFQYGGCGGNQNNFQTKEDCEKTCRVLSSCEQTREENLKLKQTNTDIYIPSCHTETKQWEPVQCLDSVGICWCVNLNGEEIPGTMTKGHPQCNSRSGRKFDNSTEISLCENDMLVHACDSSVCENKVCLAYLDAVCHVDPCGGCAMKFYNSSGFVVDCNEGLSPCQMEFQNVLNSDAWLNEHVSAFSILANTDAKPSIAKRDLLSGTLSFLKNLVQGIDDDFPKESYDLAPLTMVEEFSSEAYVLDPYQMGPVLPQCLPNGDYNPVQTYKSLKWCVTPDGKPLHESLTQENIHCSPEGNFIQHKNSKSLCSNGSKPIKVCQKECLNAKCSSNLEAICRADPCNNCEITFTDKEGNPINCQDKCLQPVEVGMCRASFRNWFYNQTSGDCEEFIFGGCLGNDNNFDSYETCIKECKHPVDVCHLPKKIGMCRASMHRWYYNFVMRRCEEFIYGGCDGNQNNFETKEECEAICPDLVLCNHLDNNKKLKACSRRKACEGKQCFGHEDVICTVDSCNNCSPIFVDLDGIEVKCDNDVNNLTSEIDIEKASTTESIVIHTKKKTRCEKQRLWAVLHNGHIPECDKDGRFEPMQCDDRNVEELQPFCWCVDEAGNQVQGTIHFIKGSYLCRYLKVIKIEVSLVFHRPENDDDLFTNETLIKQAVENILPKTKMHHSLNLTVETQPSVITVKFVLDDADKVDVAYELEEQIKSGQLALVLNGHVLYAIHSASTFRHEVEDIATLENEWTLSSGSIAFIAILTLLTMILTCMLIGGVLIYRRRKIGMYPKGSADSLASSTTQLHVYDSKTHLDMSSPLLHNLKNERDTQKMAVSTVENEYAVISPVSHQTKKNII